MSKRPTNKQSVAKNLNFIELILGEQSKEAKRIIRLALGSCYTDGELRGMEKIIDIGKEK